jgi:hypothetical protein
MIHKPFFIFPNICTSTIKNHIAEAKIVGEATADASNPCQSTQENVNVRLIFAESASYAIPEMG